VRIRQFWAVLTGACTASSRENRPVFQNLLVWNQTDQPERIAISVDGTNVYSGILGTIESEPKIVRTQSLAFPRGQHSLSVSAPARAFTRTVQFSVADRPVNLHVMVNRDEVEVTITYGPEAYL